MLAQSESRDLKPLRQMLIGFSTGLIAGLFAYATQRGAPWVEIMITYVTEPIGQIFLRLLFLLTIPLLFSALVVRISCMAEARALKRVGFRTLACSLISSLIAVGVGYLMVNLLQPGRVVEGERAGSLAQSPGYVGETVRAGREPPPGIESFVSIIPQNMLEVLGSNGAIISVMFFALFFGAGLMITDTPGAQALTRGFNGLFEVMRRLIAITIRVAPIAVACFMFNLVALTGGDLLIPLSAYIGVVLLALGIQMLVVFPMLLIWLGNRNPTTFFRQIWEVIATAFSTASSDATLFTSVRLAEEKLRLPRRVSSFVLQVGAIGNRNGTAIFQVVTVIFTAQFLGLELTYWQQLMVVLACIIGSVGTVGIPTASLPVVALILAMFGIPPEAIAFVLVVDRFLDMFRTTVNVAGGLVLAEVISVSEPQAGRVTISRKPPGVARSMRGMS